MKRMFIVKFLAFYVLQPESHRQALFSGSGGVPFGYDDSLDVFGVHGVAGTLGVLLAGVFGTRAVTGGSDAVGLLEGNAGQMVTQVVSVVATIAISVVVTFVLLKILDAAMKLRVSKDNEIHGLDITEHGEEGYIFQ